MDGEPDDGWAQLAAPPSHAAELPLVPAPPTAPVDDTGWDDLVAPTVATGETAAIPDLGDSMEFVVAPGPNPPEELHIVPGAPPEQHLGPLPVPKRGRGRPRAQAREDVVALAVAPAPVLEASQQACDWLPPVGGGNLSDLTIVQDVSRHALVPALVSGLVVPRAYETALIAASHLTNTQSMNPDMTTFIRHETRGDIPHRTVSQIVLADQLKVERRHIQRYGAILSGAIHC
eukprot:4606363-Pyramimonas_sp.AAC.1